MNILGLSCYHHDAAACLVRDGEVVSAAMEAWFDRENHSSAFPAQALNECLLAGGITIDDVDRIAFYEKPFLKLERVLLSHVRAFPGSLKAFLREVPPWLENRLILPITLHKEHGYDGKVLFFHHHLCHAAAAFLSSPFDHAAILVADGVGEWSTLSMGKGTGSAIALLRQTAYPNSVGLFYTAMATFLGFDPLEGEGRVEALSRTGTPSFRDRFQEVVQVVETGGLEVNPRYLPFFEGERMFSPALETVLGPARRPDEPVTQEHRDLAATVQAILEDVLVRTARTLHREVGGRTLCMAGGVARNTLAVGKILEETPFEHLYIPPEPGDAGAAVGAALYLAHALQPDIPRRPRSRSDLGPVSSRTQVEIALKNRGYPFQYLEESALADTVARRLEAGEVVGWFQGRMDFAPQDLGHRAILTAPGTPDAHVRLARARGEVEPVPPVQVCLPAERLEKTFDLALPSPFKHLELKVRPEFHHLIAAPAGQTPSARVLALPRDTNQPLHTLLETFIAHTGVPMLLCDTMAHRAAPPVAAPADALDLFDQTAMDLLVIEGYVVERKDRQHPGGS